MQEWNKLGVLRNWKGEEGPSLREIVEYYIDKRWPTKKKSAAKKEQEAIDSLSNTEEAEKTNANLPEKTSTNLPEEKITAISGEEGIEGDVKEILKEQKEMREALRKLQGDMMKIIKNKSFKEKRGETALQQSTTVNQNQTRIMKKILIEEEDLQLHYTTGESKVKDEEWNKLRDTLHRFNVSMKDEKNELRDTLIRYNVSMDGIQAFQKFRFYCQPGYLPWPLPK